LSIPAICVFPYLRVMAAQTAIGTLPHFGSADCALLTTTVVPMRRDAKKWVSPRPIKPQQVLHRVNFAAGLGHRTHKA
jgi:hypothetical protein